MQAHKKSENFRIGMLVVCILGLLGNSPAGLHAWQFHGEDFTRFPLSGIGLSWLPIHPLMQDDLDGDGNLETLHLVNGQAEIQRTTSQGSLALWQSPPEWRVIAAQIADLNRDGVLEVDLLVVRPFKPWPIDAYLVNGGRIQDFHDRYGLSCHFILIGWKRGKFRELWAGSAQADPYQTFQAADLDGDGLQELVALERQYDDSPLLAARALDVWEWNGFGFTLQGRAYGSFLNLQVVRGENGKVWVLTQ